MRPWVPLFFQGKLLQKFVNGVLCLKYNRVHVGTCVKSISLSRQPISQKECARVRNALTWDASCYVVVSYVYLAVFPGASSETYAPVWTWRIVSWLPISLFICFWWRHEFRQL